MRQTKEILEILSSSYTNINYYQTIVENIEKNVDSNPDMSIESCKALLEGLSKFIWKQIDHSYDALVADKMDFHPLVRLSMSKLADLNEDIELDFVNKVNKLIVSIGEVRNKRGDISHGKLSPKEYFSDRQFAYLVMNITDNMLYYVLHSFSKISPVKELVYEDNSEFNEWLDEINPIGTLSYSKALFDQDKVAYEFELSDYLENKKTES